MPTIEVSDATRALVTGYARLWGQTEIQAVDILIRLYAMPVHTVVAPPATTTEPGGTRASEEVR